MDIKNIMDVKYLKNVFLRVLSALLLAGFIFYTLYHATGGFSTKVKTVVAEYGTKQATLSLEAYILRNEKPIYSGYGGVINYHVTDGEKLGYAADIADVYSDGPGSEVRRRIIDIDKKIQLLEASHISDNIAVAGVSGIDDAIAGQLLAIREHIFNNQFDYAAKAKESLLIQMNRRQLITTSKSDFKDEIALLKQEKAALASNQTGAFEKVRAPVAGYFYSMTDGYEYVFAADKVDTMTVSEFNSMIQSAPDQSVFFQKNRYGVGKVAEGHYWYIACKVDKKILSEYAEGRVYSVVFPYSGDMSLSMTLYRIVTEDGNPDAVLIFSSSVIPPDFSFLRKQKVEISYSTPLAGYKIPTSAIRILDGVTGVYVQYGSRIYFKIAEIVGEIDGYCYIRAGIEGRTLFADDDIEGNEIYCQGLRQNDHVVVEGVGLYHGKHIG